MKGTIYGSAPTLDAIGDVIAAFYCGERKDLQADPMEPDTWRLYWPDLHKPPHERRTAPLRNVRVRRTRKRGREVYVFERYDSGPL